MRILLATSNPHKVQEIRSVVEARGGPAVQLLSLADLGRAIAEPVEDEPTFEGNAVKKARYYAQASGLPTLADDSGLEVDALGGEPGVRSARYCGVSGPRSVVDPANNRLLLERLGDTPPERRTARFVCAMALVWAGVPGRATSAPGRGTSSPAPAGDPAVVRGVVEGRILLPSETSDPRQPECGRGTNGFGYDPLFLISSLGKTTAELSPEQKNAISHRGQATRLMWDRLAVLVG